MKNDEFTPNYIIIIANTEEHFPNLFEVSEEDCAFVDFATC